MKLMRVRPRLILSLIGVFLLVALGSGWMVSRRTNALVETEIGLHMAVQAEIAAYYVKAAVAAGMSKDEINRELHQISESVSRIWQQDSRVRSPYEFWITDESGWADLRSKTFEEYQHRFRFDTEHPEQQPQASFFLPLLKHSPLRDDGHSVMVRIQEARRREISNDYYKYVAVGGVDRPRIVQVGFDASHLLRSVAGANRVTVFLLLAAVLLGGSAVHLVFERAVNQPLATLIDAIESLKKRGAYDERAVEQLLKRQDEFSLFAEVFRPFAKTVTQERLKSIFLELNERYLITDCNDVATRVFGYTREQLLNQHMKILIPQGTRAGVETALAAVQDDQPRGNFNANVAQDGRELWIHWHNRVGRREADNARVLYCVGTSMSDLVAGSSREGGFSPELLRFAKHVQDVGMAREEAVRNMRLFLSDTAHELRRPLHAINGFAGLLAETPLTREQEEHVKVIRDQSRYLGRNIENLLDDARIERNELRLEAADFSLRKELAATVSGLQFMAAESCSELRCEVDESVSDNVNGDRRALLSLLENLIVNALKHSPEGKVEARISQAGVARDGVVRLRGEVSDTGVGISEDAWDRIFERHVRLPMPAGIVTGGLGLGLAICRKYASLMNGYVRVKSSIPKLGSVFEFEIDLKMAAASDREAAARDDARMSEFQERLARLRLRALIVDDHKVDRDFHATLMRKLGFQVDLANGGVEALKMEAGNEYAVLLLDIYLPDLNGFEIAGMLNERPGRRPRIIAISANAPHEVASMEEWRRSGIDFVMRKAEEQPLRQLVAALYSVLEPTLNAVVATARINDSLAHTADAGEAHVHTANTDTANARETGVAPGLSRAGR